MDLIKNKNLLILVGFMLLFGPFSYGQPLDPQPLCWYRAKEKQICWLSLSEVVFFTKAGTGWAEIQSLFPQAPKILEQRESRYHLRITPSPNRQNLMLELSRLRQCSGVFKALPVFYGKNSGAFSSRLLFTEELILAYRTDLSAPEMVNRELQHNLWPIEQFSFVEKGFRYAAGDVFKGLEVSEKLGTSPKVLYCYPNQIESYLPRITPNDPNFTNQWHLKNTGQSGGTVGEDIANGNIETIWNTCTGTGMVIAILDTGVEINHPDLKDNILTGRSLDYADGDTDPTSTDEHGTAVAGLAGARGFNGIGVVGAAPKASLIGYRLIGVSTVTDAEIADGLIRNLDVVQVHNNSWGPADESGELSPINSLIERALLTGVTSGRQGKGIVYVWAAGNGGNQDNSNLDGFSNNRFSITVGATDYKGVRAFYSEKGANILVVAPGGSPSLGMETTDLTGFAGHSTGDYLNNTSNNNYGTSFAAPLVSGCVALILEANPNLSWRDVQQIIAKSAKQNDRSDSDWATNGAGLKVNHKYGFGRIDLEAALNLAQTWTNLGAHVETAQVGASPHLTIPDNSGAGVESTIQIVENIRIEHVEVYFTASDHPNWTDLEVTLISPTGSRSVLTEPLSLSASGSSFNNWRFMSVRHLDETSAGTWKLVVKDLKSGNTGTFQTWGIKFYGTDLSADQARKNALLKKFFLVAQPGSSGGCALDPRNTPPDGLGLFLPLLLLLIGMVWWSRQRRQ